MMGCLRQRCVATGSAIFFVVAWATMVVAQSTTPSNASKSDSGAPVLRPRCTETTSLGAAYLAGIGAGLLDRQSIEENWALERRFEPGLAAQAREELYRGWQRSVRLSLGWAEKRG